MAALWRGDSARSTLRHTLNCWPAMPITDAIAADAPAILTEIAADLRRPPRETSGDPLALRNWLKAMARRVEGVAAIRAGAAASPASVARHGRKGIRPGDVTDPSGRRVGVEVRRARRIVESR